MATPPRTLGCALLVTLAPWVASAQAAPPLLRLGRPAWVASEPFTRVSALRELANGDVIVSDPGDRALVLLTRSGATRRAIGRTGAGPLEYESPTYLVALPSDSTLVIDAPARRALLLAPSGAPVGTVRFPEAMGVGAELVRGADARGFLYHLAAPLAPRDSREPIVPLIRWRRRDALSERVALVRVPQPQPMAVPLSDDAKRETGFQSLVARRIQPFTPQDDWGISPSGRIVIARTAPYRIDWIDVDGRLTAGPAMPYTPIAVTMQDKREREPNGPPFRFTYPATKPPFESGPLVDRQERVWVRRSMPAGARTVLYDVFDRRGAFVGSATLPSAARLVAFGSRFTYVLRTDDDGLEWLEAHAR